MQNDAFINSDTSSSNSNPIYDETGKNISPLNREKRRNRGFLMQYRLLLWKSFILRRRQPFALLLEFFLPLILLFVVMGLRFSQEPSDYPACHVFSQPLPSMGFLAYTHSLICNFNLECTERPEEGLNTDALMTFIEYLRKLTSLASTNNKRILDFICDPASLQLAQVILSSEDFESINSACNIPGPFGRAVVVRNLMRIALEKNSSSLTSPADLDEILNKIENASLYLCGRSKGGNSILSLIGLLRNRQVQAYLGENNVKGTKRRNGGNQVCFILDSLFRNNNIRPFISRLYVFLTGTVFYYPENAFTEDVMRKANISARNLNELKNIFDDYESAKDTLLPDLLLNSPISKQIQTMATLCINAPGIDAELKRKCQEISDFFIETLPDNDPRPHWSKLVIQINGITAILSSFFRDCINYDRFQGFNNETKMLDQALSLSQSSFPVIAIKFEETPSSNSTLFSMTFRLPTWMIDGTNKFKVLDKFWSQAPRVSVMDSMKYFTSGFIDLQDSIERAYISLSSSPPNSNASLYSNEFLPTQMKLMPNPCFRVDPMIRLFSMNLPMMIVIIWICSVVIITRAIVYEKETRLKEFTKVMGMSDIVHWVNWFTIDIILLAATSLVACLILKFGRIFPNSDLFLLFCVLIAYCIAIIGQAFLVSTFFINANFAALFAGIFYFIMFMPYALLLVYDLEFYVLCGLALFPQVALAMAFERIGGAEDQGFGVQWDTLWNNNLTNEQFSLGICMLMLLVDFVLTCIGTWYMENVLPNGYGVPLPWYYPFTLTYWRKFFGKERHALKFKDDTGNPVLDDDYHEKPEEGLVVGVSVQGLSKSYRKMAKPAVNNLWVDFYENQITAFLGHNGAGKTTTISILTGIYSPSSGTAYMYGRNLLTDLTEIRQELGLCPQHNVLYDHLTVKEHLIFYARLKGLDEDEVKSEVNSFLTKLKLVEKADDQSHTLSGGQKRRLSLAAAFIGGSKIIYLDEPTAGVDPHSRRNIWKLIFQFKESRTIILTTHHMDEADILGDRIVIISQGAVKASGSSLFLKSNFAKYYYLCLEKLASVDSKERDAELEREMSSHLKGCRLVNSNQTEWLFTLPAEEAYNAQGDSQGFVSFFSWIENNRHELSNRFGIRQIGLSDTNLEEIFILLSDDPSSQKVDISKQSSKWKLLKHLFHRREQRRLKRMNREDEHKFENEDADALTVAYDEKEDEKTLEITNYGDDDDKKESEIVEERLTGLAAKFQQSRAFFIKRFHCNMRTKRGWFLEVVVPPLTVVLLMLFVNVYIEPSSPPLMPLHPWLMAFSVQSDSLTTFYENNVETTASVPQIQPTIDTYSNQILTKSGWAGTRCLPPSVYKFEPSVVSTCNANYKPPRTPPHLSAGEIVSVETSTRQNCTCNLNGMYTCPSGDIPAPPEWRLATNDELKNLTYYYLPEYIVVSRNDFILKRYGGLSIVANKQHEDIVILHAFLSNKTTLEAALSKWFNNTNATNIGLKLGAFLSENLPPTQFARVWYNNKGYPASVSYLNVLHNMQLRLLLLDNKLNGKPRDDFGIAIALHPLITESASNARSLQISLFLYLFKAIGTVLALAFIPSSFATFLIRERTIGSKDLQFLSGMSRFVYWTSAYVWDFITFLLVSLLVIIIFFIFDEQAFIGRDSIGAFIGLLVLYGFCITPCMYLFTFVINQPSVAFVALLGINLMISILTSVTVYMLDLVGQKNEAAMNAKNILVYVFLIFPQFSFSRGFYELAVRDAVRKFQAGAFINLGGMFDINNMGGKYISLVVEGFIFYACVLILEYRKIWRKISCKAENVLQSVEFQENFDDQDAKEEYLRIIKDPKNTSNDVIRAIGLWKTYKRKKRPAVHNLTFGIHRGECFGLLGVNGAGKTTTFNMLTTHLKPDKGEIWVNGHNLNENREGLSDQIGYCPQFDALLPYLTGYETLQFYGKIRGYPEHQIDTVTQQLLTRFDLEPYARTLVGSYSGGNRRKLSTAVAVMGAPPVLLLDEPTSGMDPGAKRHLWNSIKYLLSQGCSVVLTSHSMEECEALCNRLAIMVDGQFKCFGTVLRLKERFGEGNVIEVDLCDYPTPDSNPLAQLTSLPDVQISESLGKRVIFQAKPEVPLSFLFSLLSKMRAEGILKAFTIRQASLDNVFVNFVRLHEDHHDDDDYGDEYQGNDSDTESTLYTTKL